MGSAMITTQLNENDYLEGSLFAAQRTRKRWLIIGMMAAVYLGLGLFMVFYASRDFFILGWSLIGAVIGGFVGGLISRYILLPRRLKSRFAERKALHRKSTLSWDQKGLTVENENGHSIVPWSDFLKSRENEKFILLYTSRAMFLIVPKRIFTESDQLKDFRELVLASVGVQQNVKAIASSHDGGTAT